MSIFIDYEYTFIINESFKPTNEWFSGAELGAGLMDQGKEKEQQIAEFFKAPTTYVWAYKITITILVDTLYHCTNLGLHLNFTV